MEYDIERVYQAFETLIDAHYPTANRYYSAQQLSEWVSGIDVEMGSLSHAQLPPGGIGIGETERGARVLVYQYGSLNGLMVYETFRRLFDFGPYPGVRIQLFTEQGRWTEEVANLSQWHRWLGSL